MNETNTSNSVAVKILVIIGFIATILVFIWLGTIGIKKLSPSFANLASVAETQQNYKPADELSVTTEKTVVNSGESFQISWTDMQQNGEFRFAYVCEDGVTILVRNESGTLVPMQCTEVLNLPATVTGLFLSIDSKVKRFVDVEFSIAFVSAQNEITHVSDEKMTVVNAAVSINEEVAGESTAKEDDVVTNPDPTPTPAPQPVVYTTSYPVSNPNGYTDLVTTVLATGELRNRVFAITGSLDADERSAVKFDVENIGTKTSNTWNFTITLPDGTSQTSGLQAPLKPQEHAEFVLEFTAREEDDEFGKITIETNTSRDINSKNNTSVWYVTIKE